LPFKTSALGWDAALVLFPQLLEIVWMLDGCLLLVLFLTSDFSLFDLVSDVLLEQPVILLAFLPWICFGL
jgi:hypothetical protein